MNKKITVAATIASAIFAIVSAFCWWRSSTVAVRHARAKGSGLFHDGTVAIDGNDLYKTLRAQSRWNRLGATFAAVRPLKK